MRVQADRAAYMVWGLVLLLGAILLGCGDTPTEPPVCTTYIVSAITGDTTAIPNYAGPPIQNLMGVVEAWTDNCGPSRP